ncbi:MAG: class I SAM-dependent methyltransferase [Pararhodobacter sp.]|nr:class I SAM-dependent methyltransferase [Pararhodobacter sp.]
MTTLHSGSPLYRLRVKWTRLRWHLRKVIQRSPPKGDVYYGDMATLYEAERTNSPRWQCEQQAVTTIFERLPEGLSVLDVPVGTGRFLPVMLERGHHVTGFDASDEMIAITRRRAGELGGTVETVLGDATHLPFDDGAFDVVLSSRFLRHILPYGLARQSLAEMARVCKTYAIIELGCRDRRSNPPGEDKPMRDRLSHADTLALLRAHGFEVIEEFHTTRRFYREMRIVFFLRKTGT